MLRRLREIALLPMQVADHVGVRHDLVPGRRVADGVGTEHKAFREELGRVERTLGAGAAQEPGTVEEPTLQVLLDPRRAAPEVGLLDSLECHASQVTNSLHALGKRRFELPMRTGPQTTRGARS
ncbi:hypothetical protein GCM10027427_09950 [Pseudoclavibacter terrae]